MGGAWRISAAAASHFAFIRRREATKSFFLVASLSLWLVARSSVRL